MLFSWEASNISSAYAATQNYFGLYDRYVPQDMARLNS